ncbi:aldo/keto reductase [Xanthomonas axonopodis]|uniref:aldo/keto reductase n=1 Tax=Xanthomonas axonopodis TaxID=53413 RepID=UPI0035586CC4
MTFGGTGLFDKAGNTDVAGARRLVDVSVDAGVNMIDTADLYSYGLSEEIVGQAIASHRNKLVLASKVCFPTSEEPNDRGLSRYHIVNACEASLRRLKTDRIDLYWLHAWDGQTPLEETMRALEDLTRAGKIRYVGVSNFSGWHVMKALNEARRTHSVELVGQQIHCTLQAREAEYELLPIAHDQGIGSLIWSPLAGGLLSGKYRRGKPQPEGTRMAADWHEPPVRDIEALYDIVEVLVEIAQRHKVSAAQVALAWLLTRPTVTSLVIGARNEQQLVDNLAAANLELAPEDVQQLEAVSRPALIYPYWHQKSSVAERFSASDLALFGPHLAD